MFFNFRSKPVLKNLIPQNYIDIHNHVLPGIDDGAKDIKDSLNLIQQMSEIGIDKMICTPHTFNGVWNNTPSTIQNSFNGLKNENAGLQLKYASEYLLDEHFQRLLQNNEVLTLKDNIILVELSYIQPPINFDEIIFEILDKGYIPLLAHPERYSFYFNKLKTYEELKQKGCLFQLNLMSVTGYYGTNEMKTADFLLKEGLYNFSGTDIHRKKHINVFNEKIQIKQTNALSSLLEQNSYFNFQTV